MNGDQQTRQILYIICLYPRELIVVVQKIVGKPNQLVVLLCKCFCHKQFIHVLDLIKHIFKFLN